MMCIQKCDMHLFHTEEQKQPIAYQVETGLFFELDTLFKAILECCEGLSASPGCSGAGRSIRGRGNCRGHRGIGSGGFDFGWCTTPNIQCADDRRGGSLWGFADRSFAGVLARFAFVQYSVCLLLCSWRGLWRQGHADATGRCRASDTMDCHRGSGVRAVPD